MGTNLPAQEATYFETPERAERLQLIIHLLRNAEEIPYLRAPDGAGKTRFAQHLIEIVGSSDFFVIWLNANAGLSVEMELYEQLGLDPVTAAWPRSALAAAGSEALLIVVDDADVLDLHSLGRLLELQELGARLLFLGTGALSKMQGAWDLQFVDLPPFDEAQTLAFLQAIGLLENEDVESEVVENLQRVSGGLPGPLMGGLAMTKAAPTKKTQTMPSFMSLGIIFAMIAIVGGLLISWLFQDEANEALQSNQIDSTIAIRSKANEKAVLSSLNPKHEKKSFNQIEAIERKALTSPSYDVLAELIPEEPEENLPTVVDVVERQSAVEPIQKPKYTKEFAKFDPLALAAPSSLEDEDSVQKQETSKKVVEKEIDVLDSVVDAAIAAAAQDSKPAPIKEIKKEVLAEVIIERPIVANKEVVEPPQAESKLQKPNTAESASLAWLNSQKASTYTLQLVGARNKAAIMRFIKLNNIPPPLGVFSRDLNGKPWYSLVAGVYGNRKEAIAARAKLPAPLNASGVWPRTFGSVQQGLSQ